MTPVPSAATTAGTSAWAVRPSGATSAVSPRQTMTTPTSRTGGMASPTATVASTATTATAVPRASG